MNNTIIVTPVQYKYEDKPKYHYGIRVLNRKLNQCTVIDCKTLKPVSGMYSCITLESSAGNILFNLNY